MPRAAMRVWFPRKNRLHCRRKHYQKGSAGMSESEHAENKYVIIVAGIIGGVVLFAGLAGVWLTLAT